MRPIALRRIDEIDAELHRAAQHLVRVLPIARLAPDVVVVDHPHGAEAEAVDLELADLNRVHGTISLSEYRQQARAALPPILASRERGARSRASRACRSRGGSAGSG